MKLPQYRLLKISSNRKGTSIEAEWVDFVTCAECRWARPRTLKGETGYRCVFYRVDKAENGFCDNGEREGE